MTRSLNAVTHSLLVVPRYNCRDKDGSKNKAYHFQNSLPFPRCGKQHCSPPAFKLVEHTT